MKNLRFLPLAVALLALAPAALRAQGGFAAVGGSNSQTSLISSLMASGTTPNSTELFSEETDYNAPSHFYDHALGTQDSVYDDFNAAHRFLLYGSNVYLRAGVEYSRYDFGGSNTGVTPSKLQEFNAIVALEYVVDDTAGASLEIDPGFYFENQISGKAFDIPYNAFISYPLTGSLIGTIGVAGAQYYQWPALPIGGLTWLINKQWRIEGVFPRASFVYNPSDDWEYRAIGEIFGGGYRVDHDPGVDNRENGAALEYDEYRLSAQATYSHWKPFDVVLGAGYTFERDFDYFRAGKSINVEGGLFLRLSIDANF